MRTSFKTLVSKNTATWRFHQTPGKRYICIKNTNCLAYRYRYGPKFYNWLPLFLEKVKTTGTNKNFIVRCRCFSCCYLFVSLRDFSHISIYLSRDGLIFFCFSLYGTLGLLLCLNPKSTKGVAHFLL